MYNKDNSSLGFLLESFVPKYILINDYYYFVKTGDLIPIEDLEYEDKVELVEKCRSTGVKFTTEKLKNAARILHTINLINESS
jgi:hypothetical protein